MKGFEDAHFNFDLTDPSLFGNEAAEDELDAHIFQSQFVQRSEYKSFTDDRNPILIANGYKGEGKSALLRATQTYLLKNDELVLMLKASDLEVFVDSPEYTAWVTPWKIAIVNTIATLLGATIGMAWNEDDIAFVESAERDGSKQKNFIGLIIDRFALKIGQHEIIVKESSTEITIPRLKRKLKSQVVWLLV